MDALEHEVLVHLVGHDERIVPMREFYEQAQDLRTEHRPGGVVWVVDQNDARSVRDGGADVVGVGLELWRAEWHGTQPCSAQRDHCRVGVVERFEGHHFVAHVCQSENSGSQGFGGPGRDEDLGRRVDDQTVKPRLVAGDCLTQNRHAAPGRVLVYTCRDRIAGRPNNLDGPILVGEALPQVNRSGSRGERRHFGENRRAELSAGRVVPEKHGAARRTSPSARHRHPNPVSPVVPESHMSAFDDAVRLIRSRCSISAAVAGVALGAVVVAAILRLGSARSQGG